MRAFICTVMLAFAAISCATSCATSGAKDAGVVPVVLRGIWVGSAGEVIGAAFIFTADSYSFNDSRGFFTADRLRFRKAANPDPVSKSEYPSGYKIYAMQKFGTGSYSGFVGNEYVEDPIFLNEDNTKFCYGGGDWIFTKKQNLSKPDARKI